MSAFFVGRFTASTPAQVAEVLSAFAFSTSAANTRVGELTLELGGEPWRGFAPGARLILTACRCGEVHLVELPPEVVC